MLGSRSSLLWLLAALATALQAAACAPADPRPSIVLISVDTLRADHLGTYGYARETSPRLDAFAREALVFEDAHASAPSTWPSSATLMTGFLPHETLAVGGHVMGLVADVDSLAEMLSRAGYTTLGVVGNFGLRAYRGWDQGFRVFDDEMSDRELERQVPERIGRHTTDRALELLRAHRGRPAFLWVHYQDPHGPYTPPEGFAERFRSGEAPRPLPLNESTSGVGGIPSYQRLGERRNFDDYRAAYDGEIRYLDDELGRLFDGLGSEGLLEGSLIVFTADHGEAMGEHDLYFAHGQSLHRELTHVPLILRGPGLRGRRAERVQLLDVVPTLRAVAGLDPDPRLRGRDLRASGPDEERDWIGEKESYDIDGAFDAALARGRFKLICERRSDGEACELYDLASDPGETRDLAGDPEHAGQLAALRERLAAATAEDRLGIELDAPPAPLSDEERRKLEALGYVD